MKFASLLAVSMLVSSTEANPMTTSDLDVFVQGFLNEGTRQIQCASKDPALSAQIVANLNTMRLVKGP